MFELNNVLITGMVIVVFIFIIIWFGFRNHNNDTHTLTTPFTSNSKVDCLTTRTACDISDPTACRTKCDNVDKMKCVDINKINGQTDINKGGVGIGVCVPTEPDKKCNIENGGVNVWTGFGFTNNASWDCLCTKPGYYNGPSCEDKNIAFCSGGTVSNFSCECPKNTVKLQWSDTNLPFCVSKELAGNYTLDYPNWEICFLNPDKQNPQLWATLISNELGIDVKNVIDPKYKNELHITEDMKKELCSLKGANTILCGKNLPDLKTFNQTRYTYFSDATWV